VKGEKTKVFVNRALTPSRDEAAKKLTTANSFNKAVVNPVKPKFWVVKVAVTPLTLFK
jgi:hypothetical protein